MAQQVLDMLRGNATIQQQGGKAVAKLVRGLMSWLRLGELENNVAQAIVGQGAASVGQAARLGDKQRIRRRAQAPFLAQILLQQLGEGIPYGHSAGFAPLATAHFQQGSLRADLKILNG